MKKFNLIILIIILSISFISCSKTDDNGDINNGHSKLLAGTKWEDINKEHEIYFGTPHFESTMSDGTFADNENIGTYQLYEDKYVNEFYTKFENCSNELQNKFNENIVDKDNAHNFGLFTFINGNEGTRKSYYGCIDNDTLILCDYSTIYVYKQTENNKDKLMRELNINSEDANTILDRINMHLLTDYYNITNISKNPELGYIIESDVPSVTKYYTYIDDQYNVLIVTKDKLEEDGGEIIFRQKE